MSGPADAELVPGTSIRTIRIESLTDTMDAERYPRVQTYRAEYIAFITSLEEEHATRAEAGQRMADALRANTQDVIALCGDNAETRAYLEQYGEEEYGEALTGLIARALQFQREVTDERQREWRNFFEEWTDRKPR